MLLKYAVDAAVVWLFAGQVWSPARLPAPVVLVSRVQAPALPGLAARRHVAVDPSGPLDRLQHDAARLDAATVSLAVPSLLRAPRQLPPHADVVRTALAHRAPSSRLAAAARPRRGPRRPGRPAPGDRPRASASRGSSTVARVHRSVVRTYTALALLRGHAVRSMGSCRRLRLQPRRARAPTGTHPPRRPRRPSSAAAGGHPRSSPSRARSASPWFSPSPSRARCIGGVVGRGMALCRAREARSASRWRCSVSAGLLALPRDGANGAGAAPRGAHHGDRGRRPAGDGGLASRRELQRAAGAGSLALPTGHRLSAARPNRRERRGGDPALRVFHRHLRRAHHRLEEPHRLGFDVAAQPPPLTE